MKRLDWNHYATWRARELAERDARYPHHRVALQQGLTLMRRGLQLLGLEVA